MLEFKLVRNAIIVGFGIAVKVRIGVRVGVTPLTGNPPHPKPNPYL